MYDFVKRNPSTVYNYNALIKKNEKKWNRLDFGKNILDFDADEWKTMNGLLISSVYEEE